MKDTDDIKFADFIMEERLKKKDHEVVNFRGIYHGKIIISNQKIFDLMPLEQNKLHESKSKEMNSFTVKIITISYQLKKEC